MSLYHLPLKYRMTLNFKVVPTGLCRSQPVLTTKRMNDSYIYIYNITYKYLIYLFLFCYFGDTVSYSQDAFGLSMYLRLALNSRSSCLCLLNVGIARHEPLQTDSLLK